MRWNIVIVFITLLSTICGHQQHNHHKFPPGFKFGAATAAYQIEGGWNAGDKSPSVWDDFTHRDTRKIANGSNGDVACDSYHLWRQDVQIASDLGLHFYRISISWSRLLPHGFSNYVSRTGMEYYSRIIDALIKKGIEPTVTLYHNDLPQSLQDLGGWTNPLIADWFADFARVAFSIFGDRVKTWITINEPVIMCGLMYSMALYPPAVSSPGLGSNLCNKFVLLAHAKAWRVYDEEFRPTYNGKISIVNQLVWFQPQKEEFEGLAELSRQLYIGLYSHPIYTEKGGWPPSIEQYIAEKSKIEGYRTSRLPEFTDEEISLVRGTYDFFGINYYTSREVRSARDGERIGQYPFYGAPEINAVFQARDTWPPSATDWLYVYPRGLRKVLSWAKQAYGDLEFLILENGYANNNDSLHDVDRLEYLKSHLEQTLLAIKDGVNVTHFSVWSLIDNFEWNSGYNPKFGLCKVDFTDPKRKRTPRLSAQYYASVIAEHSIDVALTNDFI